MKKYYGSQNFSKRGNYYKKPFRKTKGFYILTGLILLLFIFIFWSIRQVDPEQTDDQKFTDQNNIPILAAKVTFVEGTLELKSPDSNWQEVGENFQIQSGDNVRTANSAKAIIELPDKSLIRLSGNAELNFIELGMADIKIEQISGTAFHRVNDDSTAIYKVINGNTEMLALGTGFNILASNNLTYLTVTESKVKVKVYDGDSIVNMRTIDQSTKATINETLSSEEMIETKDVSIANLIEDDWYAWNLDQDRENDFFLGMFEAAIKLVITEPANSETSVDSNEITIKGVTDPGAEIFMAGKELDNNDGQFETTYLLGSGENEIEIIVKKDKNQNKKTLLITSTKEKESIDLTGNISDSSVELSWIAENLEEVKEFKILKGETQEPTYPEAPYHTVGLKTAKDTWQDLTSGNYFFRICALSSEDKCIAYSNTYSAEIAGTDIPEGEIKLTALADGDNVELNWTVSSSLDSSEGFKSIISQSENPVYPGNSYHDLNSNSRNDEWQKLSTGTYNFRVCLISDGNCLIYSNNINIKATTVPSKISLIGKVTDGQFKLTWDVAGLTAKDGFRTIIDDNENIVFPGDDHHLILSADQRTDTWSDLEAGKDYYFRVCENLNNACGIYSNKITLTSK